MGFTITKLLIIANRQQVSFHLFQMVEVTRDRRHPKEVAKLILQNRKNKVEYEHKYEQLRNERTGEFPSKGDTYRYAGDILDYMVLANLLQHKGTGYYYYLNKENKETINYHLNQNIWFEEYDRFYNTDTIANSEIREIEKVWFDYVNSFDKRYRRFTPRESANIQSFPKTFKLDSVGGVSDKLCQHINTSFPIATTE